MRTHAPGSLLLRPGLIALLAFTGCKGSGLVPPGVESDTDTDADADADTDADADADTDADSDADTDTNPPPGPVCQNDGYEPNNTPNLATTYAFPIAGLVLDDADLDVFGSQVPPGAELEVRIEFAHALGDIDLRLRDTTGNLLDSSTSTQDQETVTWTNTGGSTATVYAEAELLGTGGCNFFSLTMNQNTGGTQCADDVFEPNDSTSAAPTAGSPLFNLVLDAQASNEDFFKITLQPGDELIADAYFKDTDGDIDLYLLGTTGSTLTSSTSTTDNESISYVNQTGGVQTIYLKTRLFGQGCTEYDLAWNIVSAGPFCFDDSWEPNDDVNAAPFDPPSPLNGLVLDGQASTQDWWNILLAPGEELTVNLTFTDANGDIDLQIKNRAGTTLASSGSSTDNESATWKNITGSYTEVFARAFLFGQQQVCQTYSMSYVVTDDPDVCVDDAYEDNDSTSTPIPLLNIPAGGDKLYHLVSTDADWFAVEALPFESLDFVTTSSGGDLDLYLYDQNLNQIDSSATTQATELVRWSSLFGGIAVLEVRHFSGVCIDYDLYVDSDF